ncbi:MAG: hypothetical protein EKK55_11770 [Rhodocyclaceae bacterium]|nr:MAG: hypothetical protein EKK55_11770 [Rhodocyclaceae bacterium]
MTDTPPPQDPDDADQVDLDDEPLLVNQLNLHAGTALDRQGRALGAMQFTFSNSALPDAEFKLMYVGTADQFRKLGDAVRNGMRHVANRLDPKR